MGFVSSLFPTLQVVGGQLSSCDWIKILFYHTSENPRQSSTYNMKTQKQKQKKQKEKEEEAERLTKLPTKKQILEAMRKQDKLTNERRKKCL